MALYASDGVPTIDALRPVVLKVLLDGEALCVNLG